jgi:hypothetical protein
VTSERATKNINRIIPGIVLQIGHFSRDEHLLTGCDNLVDAKTLNASKQRYRKKSAEFGFAVNQRQTEVESDYRKHAAKLDAEYHQPGDATTFKSILREYDKDGEVLGFVVGYSGEASLDVYRVADHVAIRTSASIAKAMQTQRICRVWGHPLHVDSRRSSWIACRTTWTRRPALAIGGASWMLMSSLTSATRPRPEKAVFNGFLTTPTGQTKLTAFSPDNPFRTDLPFGLIRSCAGVVEKKS